MERDKQRPEDGADNKRSAALLKKEAETAGSPADGRTRPGGSACVVHRAANRSCIS
jgi:hypothetical protein